MGIAYFPEIYPDELIYSVMARLYAKAGYLAYIFCAEDIFIDKRVRPDIEFINAMKPEILELLCRNIPMEELIEKHTMFPYYAKFMPCEKRNRAFKALCSMAGDYNNLLAVPKQRNGEQKRLRYCPLCAEADRLAYGETFWHRSHQLTGVSVCPVHGCRLIESGVIINSKASPNLIMAELEVKEKETSAYGNEIEMQLAEYIGKVFQSEVDMENKNAVGSFLHSRMAGTKYLSVRGEQRNIQQFYNDFMEFYKDLPTQGITQLWQIQKVLTGYKSSAFDVCQIAMFLGIPTEDLARMQLPLKPQQQLFDESVRQMIGEGIGCNQIARELGVSSKTVRDARQSRSKRNRTAKHYKKPCGVKARDWEQIDRETLPLVQDAIRQLQGREGERPHRITEFAICKALGLPDKRLGSMPLCRSEVLKHKEAQEHYWAKEVVWAVNKIQDEGNVLNWKQIRILTNMRKDNIVLCLPYLKDMMQPELYEMVQSLL